MGDTSPVGMRRSLGLTVNYVYRLPDVERNHEAYAKNFDIVASRQFEALARHGRAVYRKSPKFRRSRIASAFSPGSVKPKGPKPDESP
jgi:hypothetical protein